MRSEVGCTGSLSINTKNSAVGFDSTAKSLPSGQCAAGLFQNDPIVAEHFVSFLQQRFDFVLLEAAERLGDIPLYAGGSRARIAVGGAGRLRDDRVDHAKLLDLTAGQMQARGQLRSAIIVF